ncbi:MAG: coenzyme F420-0:L-glutamate ligase [Candidatus Enterosoma sp.]|nr:coenzyme F420-0:L-glutamate ligase [Bacilli bacterium]MDD7181825.1 coenzyme F420-0:L-glutamate ligase [Bacilli bacterium]MDY3047545.1 coenzyme F420-0:L-glutamate ligase [Candidatus Enterosoma sp.]
MARFIGTSSRGVRLPILKEGDDLARCVVDSIMSAVDNKELEVKDRDIIAITESIVARSQGNYATIDDIASSIKSKMNADHIGVIFPILSRNRFSILLKGMARATKKITVMLSYPSDEVGNALISLDDLDASGVNPYSDVLDIKKYRELFGYKLHEFTGVDYVKLYQEIVEGEGCEFEVIFANHAEAILPYTKNVINCDIHTRKRTKRILLEKGAENVLSMDDILTEPINGCGYNEKYGLLGTNKATEDTVKLFPREAIDLLNEIQADMFVKTGKHVEVMVYGDGAFKDPQGKIWELADPVVSPFFTSGLKGTPNELKLKYLADNQYKGLEGDELKEAIKKEIKAKDKNLVGKMASEGTTPRQLTDLIGSLSDLTSGSGDKGTPVVYIQGYFDNYTAE